MQAKYPLKIQAIRSKNQQARRYVYFPLPLAAAIGLEAGEEVQWEPLAHPDGMVVGDIITELGATASTLSHHLEKLKTEGLVKVQRVSTFLRYSANADALRELLGFLYAECCTRNKAIEPQAIVSLCR